MEEVVRGQIKIKKLVFTKVTILLMCFLPVELLLQEGTINI